MNHLIIFVKNPIKGTAKTRLAKTIGEEEAHKVYLELLDHTRKIATEANCHKNLFYNKYIDEEDAWPNDTFNKKLQQEGNLGFKMQSAFKEIFGQITENVQKVIIIGSDCGDLDSQTINQAFDELEKADLVIGPAEDGGYYLLGMKKMCNEIFEEMPWSTEKLLKLTLKKIQSLGLSVKLLKQLNDIDEYEDLLKWRQKS